MNAIINLGNPRKNMTVVADAILPIYSHDDLKITGVDIYLADNVLMSSATYGAGMTLDALEELKMMSLIGRGDMIVFVGSMGSLNEQRISLGDVVIPNPCGCAYYGFQGLWLQQDEHLLAAVKKALVAREVTYCEYKHGSSFAVFDPHTDHTTYTTKLYEKNVVGVDCGEVFLGMHFARNNEMSAAALLYCSDSPKAHIGDIGMEEFGKRASQLDILLNGIAAHVLRPQV